MTDMAIFVRDGLFQRVADWLDGRLGVSCFRLARWLTWCQVVAQTTACLLVMHAPAPANAPTSLIYLALSLDLGFVAFVAFLARFERRATDGSARAAIASLRGTPQSIVVTLVLAFTMLLDIIVLTTFVAAALSHADEGWPPPALTLLSLGFPLVGALAPAMAFATCEWRKLPRTPTRSRRTGIRQIGLPTPA